MREAVQALDVAEVVRQEERVVAGPLVASPVRVAQHAQLVPAGREVAVQGAEVVCDLGKVRRRDPQGVVGLDAQVEDDDGARAGLVPKGPVWEGKLSRRAAGYGICSVLVWSRAAELQDGCDDGVEEDDGGWDDCPAERQSCG